MNRVSALGYWVSVCCRLFDTRYLIPDTRRKGVIAFIFCFSVLSTHAQAQHLRIFACAIANDSAGAFLGGSTNGSGLYQSDDTGKAWRHLGWNNIKCYSMDMVQSSNGRILYQATGLGVLRSTDYGKHWKQLTDWHISEVTDIAVNQKYPNEIWIATAHGPWCSGDAGRHWRTRLKGLYEPYCCVVEYAAPGYDTLFLGARSTSYTITNRDSIWQPSWDTPSLSQAMAHGPTTSSCAGRLRVADGDNFVLLMATLGSGIMRLGSGLKPPENSLPDHQIWRLKSFEVVP